MKEIVFVTLITAIVIVTLSSCWIVYASHRDCETLSMQTGHPTKHIATQGCFIQIGDKWIPSGDTAAIVNETEKK